jgi:Ca2+-binding RTX toxin-like protein
MSGVTLAGSAGADTLRGGAGADSLVGRAGHDFLIGSGGVYLEPGQSPGADTLVGGSGNDLLSAVHQTFGDTYDFSLVSDLRGGSGNDSLSGAGTLIGGTGNDQIYVYGSSQLVIGGSELDPNAGYDIFIFDNTLPGLMLDLVTSTQVLGADYLVGTYQADFIQGYSDRPSRIDGNFGADTLIGGTELHGGGGDDHLFGGAATTTLRGGDGNDGIVGRFLIEGEAGNDTLFGEGAATLLGGAGDDRLFDARRQLGGAGDDRLDAMRVPDRRDPFQPNTRLFGEAGDDLVLGSIGGDVVLGGNGADTAFAGAGADTLLGGVGDDRLEGQDGADLTRGGHGKDLLYGGAGADTLDGGNYADTLGGDAGRDMLLGGQGDDLIRGGADADRLEGALGADTLVGGPGNDTIVMTAGDATDLIGGWNPGDRIEIAGLGPMSFLGGAQFTGTAAEYRVETDAGTTRILFDRDGDGLADQSLRFDRVVGLTANSFITVPFGPGGGGDTLEAASTGETIRGSRRGDMLTGGAGNDALLGGLGSDLLAGGEGDDALAGLVVVDQFYENEYAGADLSGDLDTLLGGTGDDTLSSRLNSAFIDGGPGDDVLYGSVLSAGSGGDTLIGGTGNDTFVIPHGTWEERPGLIQDWDPGDSVSLYSFFFGGSDVGYYTETTTLVPGANSALLPSRFIGTAPFSGAVFEVRYEIVQGFTRVEMDAAYQVDTDSYSGTPGGQWVGNGFADTIIYIPAILTDADFL